MYLYLLRLFAHGTWTEYKSKCLSFYFAILMCILIEFVSLFCLTSLIFKSLLTLIYIWVKREILVKFLLIKIKMTLFASASACSAASFQLSCQFSNYSVNVYLKVFFNLCDLGKSALDQLINILYIMHIHTWDTKHYLTDFIEQCVSVLDTLPS